MDRQTGVSKRVDAAVQRVEPPRLYPAANPESIKTQVANLCEGHDAVLPRRQHRHEANNS
jgi:hypothetical protein